MVRLTREVRFLVDPQQQRPLDTPRLNKWAGWPSAAGLAPYLTLRMTVLGLPDRRTGYLCDVGQLDQVMYQSGVQAAYDLAAEGPSAFTAERLLTRSYPEVKTRLRDNLRLESLELVATPHLRFRLVVPNSNSEAGTVLTVTQQFEFSAAHRLHCADLSDDENRAVFGKCNNPTGHGHNYVLEVTVEGHAEAKSGVLVPIDALEHKVKHVIIDRFDHKNLNLDLVEFRDLNPSVENIAQVIFRLLEVAIVPHRLSAVRVYETPKTWAEVRRDHAG